jgi:hypothetical protein
VRWLDSLHGCSRWPPCLILQLLLLLLLLLLLVLVLQDPCVTLCYGPGKAKGRASNHLRPAATPCARLVQGQVRVTLCLPLPLFAGSQCIELWQCAWRLRVCTQCVPVVLQQLTECDSTHCQCRRTECPVWAESGECEVNPGYMIGTKTRPGDCLASCGRCDIAAHLHGGGTGGTTRRLLKSGAQLEQDARGGGGGEGGAGHLL